MSYLQIAFMPYISPERFEFGNLTFLPFIDPATHSLFSDKVLEYLQWYFAKHVDITQKPLDVTIVCYKDLPLGHWKENEVNEMYDTVSCLSFLTLANINWFFPLTSDIFALYLKYFTPGEKYLAISCGSFINMQGLYSYKICEYILFMRPESTPAW